MKQLSTCLIWASVLAVGAVPARAEMVTLNPVADASVHQFSADIRPFGPGSARSRDQFRDPADHRNQGSELWGG